MMQSLRLARLRVSALLPFLLLLTVHAVAQEAENGNGRAPATVTSAQLELLRSDLIEMRERIGPLMEAVDVSAAEAWLEDSQLERLVEAAGNAAPESSERALWQEAVEHERAGTERVRGALDRAALALAGGERLEEVGRQVGAMMAALTTPREPDPERTLSQVEEDTAVLDGRRVQVGLELVQRRQILARLEAQLRSQAETLEQLQRAREEELAAATAREVSDPSLGEALAAANAALDRRTEARLLAAQLDAQSMPARIERLRVEIRAHELERQWVGERLVELQGEYHQRSTEELRELTTMLQRLLEREPDVRQRFADEIGAMREQIDRIAQAQGRTRTLQLERADYQRLEEDLTQTLVNVRERLEIGGLTETLGGLFLEEQRRLRGLGDVRFTQRAIERELAQSRLRNITLREQRGALPTPVFGLADDSAEGELRGLQHDIVTALVQAEEGLTDELRQTEVRLRAVAMLVDELDQILRETLLWWPSHVPVGLEWSLRVPAALLALADLASWQEVQSALLYVSIGSPVATFLTLLLVGLLWHSGLGTRGHLRQLAEKTRHRFTDNITLTFKAMGWSVLRVLPVPVLLISTAYRLEQIPEAGHAIEILAAMLWNAAIWWVAGHLFLLFTSRNGVGTVHFEWSEFVVRRLRRNLAWYLPTQFVLVLVLALAFGHPNDLAFDVLGRAALVASGLLAGVLLWRLLKGNPERQATAAQERRRRLLRLASVSYALGLVALALAGYLLTVSELLGRTIDTVVVLGLVYLGYRLAARALILSETRLRIRRMREERAQAAALESNSAVGGEGAVEVAEPHLSIEDINVQTRSLLGITAGAASIVALFWVWADVLPALTWLDGITLWSRTVAVGDIEILSRVSLQDALMAVFLGVLFTLAGRNLPGLVEILLTRGTEVDAAGRYTIATLLRYAITVVAVITVFSLLGLRWSELQWMVAALTLGLGFGLQEVVANFVSGLIMLFERPVRVGDTITIGEYSGTVARIRTRATTIIDWDNREIVVPNKTFITERLINWTLSDTITRIIVPVGVSYDADVDLVMQSLEEIAKAHPLVLDEPPPTVLFLKFGDSALSFELRIYVSELRARMVTVSELHQAIIRVFRERGIEIAYPQMDLHVRDLPKGQSWQPSTSPATVGSTSGS